MSKQRRTWTEAEEFELKRLHKAGATIKEIVTALKRPLGSVGNKVVALGLSSRISGKQHRQPGLNSSPPIPGRIATGVVTNPQPGLTVHMRTYTK